MRKLPLGRNSPLGAEVDTWSLFTQYASAEPSPVFQALLKATVACAISRTSVSVCPFPPLSTKKGEPKRSAWYTTSSSWRCLFTSSPFEWASLPPIASLPSLVENHLNFSYHSCFFLASRLVEGLSLALTLGILLERRVTVSLTSAILSFTSFALS